MDLLIPKNMQGKVIEHMEQNKDWTIYSVAKVLNIPESQAPLLLDGMKASCRIKLVFEGKVKSEHSMEGTIRNDIK